MVHSFDLWLSMKNMKRISHQTLQYGNCLYESIANCIHCGKENQLNWDYVQLIGHVCKLHREHNGDFEDREGNLDNYGKHSFLEYLDFVTDPHIHGTEYDIIMLCGFINILIDVYTSSLLSNIGWESRCEPPLHFEKIVIQM
jgi:hypothetical protein